MKPSLPRGSRFESRIRDGLTQRGVFFETASEDIPGRPDIVFPNQKVAIFLDGCFWHGCPTHWREPRVNADYWTHRMEQTRRHDRFVERRLMSEGWKVGRFWEHEPTQIILTRIVRLKATAAS